MADVRVGIVSWNTADLLERCLAALPAALAGVDAEVVVVDNASSDGSDEVPARHPDVTAIRNEVNTGYARGMNQALAGTDAPVLIALNPDTEPAPGSLATLVRRMLDDPKLGLIAPRLAYDTGELQHSVYRFPSLPVAAAVCFVPPRMQRGAIGRRFWLEGAAPHDTSGPIDWALGAVHVIRASALAGALPYSERWFMYAEDLEICWRLSKAGWIVRFEADVNVRHASNASGSQAWGSTRAARYWAATYDVVGEERSRLYARLWAAVNTAGVAMHMVLNRLGALLPGAARARRRHAAADLRSVFPVHVRALVHGPPTPDGL